MLFSKIATSALMGLAVGQDAPLLSKAAAATVAPVVLGQHSSGGNGDTGRPEFGPAEMVALQEAVKRQVPEAKTGLRGAGGGRTEVESNQPLNTWRYEIVKMRASVRRTRVFTLAAGSGSEWGTKTTVTEQHRTTRKMLYEEVQSAHGDLSLNVEYSMKSGFSFPFEIVSFSTEVEAGFSAAITAGFAKSATSSDEYEQETVTSYTTETNKIYRARPAGNSDMVVYEEEYKIGNRVLEVQYLACDKAESERDGWGMEVEELNAEVGVDYQWYHIQAIQRWYHTGPNVWEISQEDVPLAKHLDNYDYTHQWAYVHGHLISRGGLWELQSQGGGGFVMNGFYNHGDVANVGNGFDWRWTSENQLRDGYGLCLDISNYDGIGYLLHTVHCGSVGFDWEFVKVASVTAMD